MAGASGGIAFLGIGLMGDPMARRLLGAGFKLTAWNRTRSKAEALAGAGAVVAESAAAAVAEADIVITMLEAGSVVEDVLFKQGAAEAMQPGALLIDMSSIAPGEARDHAERLGRRGIAYLDAPVSGGTVGAEQGTLAIMAGGEKESFERAGPLFAAMGTATLVGPTGAGQVAKLCNQAIVAINIAGVAEALLLAAACGADPAAVRQALTGGFADSKVLQVHGARMLERDFRPGGRVRVHIKDLTNILNAAHDAGVQLPVSSELLKLFEGVRDDLGGEGFDHASILLQLEAMAKGARVGDAPDQLPEA